MPVGCPPIWSDAEAFDKKVDEYFDDKEETHTWTGLALYLGFESRQSLEDYKKKEGFSYSIKKALTRIEALYEQRMIKSNNPSGSIFALKNFGWKDKQEVDMTAKVSTAFLNIDPLADDQTDNSTTQDSATTEA